MKRRASARTVGIGLVIVGLALTWFFTGRQDGDDSASSEHSDPALLLDRVWVDSKPEKYTDYTHVMLALSHAPIGIFQKASAYQATTELFEFKRRDALIGVHFPQSGTKRETAFRIHECSDLPPFDLCLELAQNPWGGPRRYYGLTDPDQERAELGDLRHQLEHRMADPAGSAD